MVSRYSAQSSGRRVQSAHLLTAGDIMQFSTLEEELRKSIAEVGLAHISEKIVSAAKPAILIELMESEDAKIAIGDSKIGGNPDLPSGYKYPQWKNRPMGFVGQMNLASASQFDIENLLPKEGVLSFFYDFYEQPWGYDPEELGFSKVEYFPPSVQLIRQEITAEEIRLKCSGVLFSASLTVPFSGSQSYAVLQNQYKFNHEEEKEYWDLPSQMLINYRQTASIAHHHLLGHSYNIQGDMQLEAELVTNGLYCGDPSGYNDPKAKILEPLSGQWQLLFQLDSDDIGDFMWGDGGMLYYWIRQSDLMNRKFENHWMTMQCY
jgi:uncharacterized protein YwqG